MAAAVVVANGTLTVDGMPRNVTWDELATPENRAGRVVGTVGMAGPGEVGETIFMRDDGNMVFTMPNPAVIGHNDTVTADLAFASIGRAVDESGVLPTKFYVPCMSEIGGKTTMSLQLANEIKFGDKSLAGFTDGRG